MDGNTRPRRVSNRCAAAQVATPNWIRSPESLIEPSMKRVKDSELRLPSEWRWVHRQRIKPASSSRKIAILASGCLLPCRHDGLECIADSTVTVAQRLPTPPHPQSVKRASSVQFLAISGLKRAGKFLTQTAEYCHIHSGLLGFG